MQQNWKGTTYGNRWMHKWIVRLLAHIDLRLMYAFAAVFIIPVCLIATPRRKYIYSYFRKRWMMSPMRSMWMTYRNFYIYMQQVVDRFAVFAGKRFKMEIEGDDIYQKLISRKEGFVQLCSHIGNSEIAGYTLSPKPKKMTVLVYGGEKADVMESRRKAFNRMGINMVAVENDINYIFEISCAIHRGDIVSSPADRIIGSTRTVKVSLLAEQALLPAGPFAIGATYNLDVVELSVMKVRHDTYRIYVTPIEYDKNASRTEKIRQMANAYIAEMERLVKLYPTQWYNFYDFWNTETDRQ